MAGISATVTNLRIQDQQLLAKITVAGDAGGYAEPMLVLYDAGGTERRRMQLGRMDAGQDWDLMPDLNDGSLEDGDYGAWIYTALTAADGTTSFATEQGISFLVGRGEVYPSREAVDKRTFEAPVEPTNLRLEGSWVVFDMKNTAKHDVEVHHHLMILSSTDSTDPHRASGEELVRAGATQQGHYLLPEQMTDGRYDVSVVVEAQGSDAEMPLLIAIDVRQGVVSVAP
jgi:2-phospho-L-lactate transferase/gluconeogenesis factor (CofD/UPF0052 family)